MLLCSIYDTRHRDYLSDCYYRTRRELDQQLAHLTSDKTKFSLYSEFPQDYEVHIFGSFDYDSVDGNNIVVFDTVERVRFSDYVRSQG